MGIRDLFSRGPKLPEPVDDPYDGDPSLSQDVAALQRGNWKPAAARVGAARGDDRTFFASHFAAAGRGPVEAWHEAEPSSAANGDAPFNFMVGLLGSSPRKLRAG